jgi:hypothetical protein
MLIERVLEICDRLMPEAVNEPNSNEVREQVAGKGGLERGALGTKCKAMPKVTAATKTSCPVFD